MTEYFFLICITKNTNCDRILFSSILWMSLILREVFESLQSSFFAKYCVILENTGRWSTGCKYLTKHYLKHLLSSIFQILTKHFLGLILLVIWYNCCQLFRNINFMIYDWIINPAWAFSGRFLYVLYNWSIDWFKYIINVTFINNCFCFWV